MLHYAPHRAGSVILPLHAEDLQIHPGSAMAQASGLIWLWLAGIQAFPSTAACQSPSEMFNIGQGLKWECSAGRATSPAQNSHALIGNSVS